MKQIAILICLSINTIASKVLIITHNYNRPDFIEMQYKTFKKFLNDDYEYVVFNDARTESMEQQINNMCSKYGIRCVRIPQEIHTYAYLPREPQDDLQTNISIRHVNCVQYSLNSIGYKHNGAVFIVDADIVLIRPFSIEKYMQDKDIAGKILRPRNKASYFSPLFCILNMNRLPNKTSLSFNCGTINGVPGDSGSWSYYYLSNNPGLKAVPVRVTFSHQLFLADKHINKLDDSSVSDDSRRSFYGHFGFNDTEIAFFLKKPDTFEFYLDNLFLHYRGSSYTTGDTYKYQIFKEFVNEILKDNYTGLSSIL